MKLTERMERNYCLNLLRYGNIIINELRGDIQLPSEANRNHKSMLMKRVIASPKQDKSALGSV